MFFGAGAGACALVFDVTDRQPEQFDDGVVVREVPPVLDDLSELVAEGLDRVRGVDDLADPGGKARNGVKRSQALTGANGPQAMGTVMKTAGPIVAGRAEGGRVAAAVRAALAG